MDCFKDLRDLKPRYQVSTKASADGGTRIAVALERIPDSIGTSGTIPWAFIRFAIERGTHRACVKEGAPQLMYKTSHHNCMDSATVTANGVTYTITGPDRATATVAAAGAGAFPATALTNKSCRSSDDNQCGSGQPCH